MFYYNLKYLKNLYLTKFIIYLKKKMYILYVLIL